MSTLEQKRIVDLTHTLSPEIPTWDADCGFRHTIDTDYTDGPGPDYFRSCQISARAGIGTHIDAPAHRFEGNKTVDALRLEDLIADCVVIDVSTNAHEKLVVLPETIAAFEKQHGQIKPNSFVIFYTGWAKYWTDPKKYQNKHQFPSVHEETAGMLLERNIVGLGTDTLSADSGGLDFPVHRAVLGAQKYLVENIANAEKLPAIGSRIFVMPIKIQAGTEAPIRLIALI